MYTVGIDTGGTFTDFVFFDGSDFFVHKVLSTPEDPSIAIITGLNDSLSKLSKINEIIHGSTVATNALLERKGARTALITTKGFEDVLEIKRQNRGDLYDLFWNPKPIIVGKNLRFGLSERIDYSGKVLKKLDNREIEVLVGKLQKLKVESIAICFLNSYANSANEFKVEKKLKKLKIPITVSSKLVPEFREYERTSTTVVNSYLIPKVGNYMNSLSNSLKNIDITIMQSNGGAISTDQAAAEPSRIILSGPAGGVVGAFKLCKAIGRDKIITYDMGGTSTDISLCDGDINFTTETVLDDIPIKIPMINISTIGAGGGSIAYIDEGGVLKVGPQSAGANPGPACYGKGLEPTVTDANVILGRIEPDWFLGGKMDIYPDRSYRALSGLELDHNNVTEIAESVINIANSNMERALRVISIGSGYDPREFSLVSFGGAGGLHSCQLAKSIGVSEVIFPFNPGALSAFGMLLADSFKDYGVNFFTFVDEIVWNELDTEFSKMKKRAINDFGNSDLLFEGFVDARYKGQSHELTIKYNKRLKSNFNKEHNKVYGYFKADNRIEIVALRLRAYLDKKKIKIPRLRKSKQKVNSSKKDLIFNNRNIKAKLYKRDDFYNGFKFKGPCVILEKTSTIFIPDKSICEVDKYGNILTRLN
ncbi:MAG: hydantoinase/oxoprolinase family protein [Candidatus Dadabacteria bacterium]|nr:hydantoinase/oxoprolinase family protein [Candidatus Dadabacteria bacterium]